MKTQIIVVSIIVLAFTGCDRFKKGEGGMLYKKGDGAMLYKMVEDIDGGTIKEGDFTALTYTVKTEEGAVLYNSNDEDGRLAFKFRERPYFKGDFFTALGLLSEGDSAIFKINVDSLVAKTGKPKPPTAGKYLIYTIKVNKVIARGELTDSLYNSKIEGLKAAEMEKAKMNETAKFNNYLSSKNVKTVATASGLNYTITREGTGPKPAPGDTVELYYTAKFLSGKVIETSSALHKAPVVTGSSLSGFQEALLLFPKGTKVTLIIPSKLAYGSNTYKNIQPYTALLCELEIVDIIHPVGRATISHNDTIYITSFGVQPDSRLNIVAKVQAALQACKKKTNPVLIFPKGRYDFWPQYAIERTYHESNSTDNNPKCNAILIEQQNNLVIDGNGSSFIYHGTIQPFTIDDCRNISIRNIKIDWEFPLTGQGEVVDTASDHIDVKIDEGQYPFEIDNGKLMFVGEGWKSGIWIIMEYERDTHIIAPRTGDIPALGKDWQKYTAQRIGNGVVRLNYPFNRKPKPGNILIFRHNPRDHAAMFIQNSKNIQLSNMDIYHCAGLGILAQYTENLDYRKINCVPNAEKGRYFSGHDDGMHYSNCKGNITVDSCRFAGLMDDPINIHGTYVKIIQKLGSNKLLCRFMEPMSLGMIWARRGEEVGFINHKSLQTVGEGVVAAFTSISTTDFDITFKGDIPKGVQIADGLENLTWTPAATITNSDFESCRARGILVTTPKKVVIENNVFSSSGSAILIAGDVNSWYESGAAKDILIKGNIFLAATLTSHYQFCEAVISIFPEIPVMDAATPCYHRNIRIENNEFHPFDYPVLFAQSVDNLKFENNKLIRSYDYKPSHYRKVTFSLIGCKAVSIKNNQVDKDLLGKNIKLEYMSPKEVDLSQPEIHFDKL